MSGDTDREKNISSCHFLEDSETEDSVAITVEEVHGAETISSFAAMGQANLFQTGVDTYCGNTFVSISITEWYNSVTKFKDTSSRYYLLFCCRRVSRGFSWIKKQTCP